MQPLSVVIVCKNEADIIAKTLESVKDLTDDIVVYDNGSIDGTLEIVRKSGARLYEGCWEGFGNTKRKALQLAKYSWVLALDADEVISMKLLNSLLQASLSDENKVYEVNYKLFFRNKAVRFGAWAGEKFTPLFNRNVVNWDNSIVHEKLVIPSWVKKERLRGDVLHFSIRSVEGYIRKRTYYAVLCAQKYFSQGRRSSFVKIYLAAGFAFFKDYFLKLGFLDGWEGFFCAKVTSYYTFVKYARLLELNKAKIR